MHGSPPPSSAPAPCCSRGGRWSSARPPWPRAGRPSRNCGAVPRDERPRGARSSRAADLMPVTRGQDSRQNYEDAPRALGVTRRARTVQARRSAVATSLQFEDHLRVRRRTRAPPPTTMPTESARVACCVPIRCRVLTTVCTRCAARAPAVACMACALPVFNTFASRAFLRSVRQGTLGHISRPRPRHAGPSGSSAGPAAVSASRPAGAADVPAPAPRPRVAGKFLFVGTEKLYVRGVTYGAFAPDAHGNEYHDLSTVERDFAQMAANGINAVRIPHTMPPRALLDLAARHGLRVMVGLSAEQYIGYLIDRHGAPDIEALIRDRVRSCTGHPALLCYALANEIPAPMARWLGRRRVHRYRARP